MKKFLNFLYLVSPATSELAIPYVISLTSIQFSNVPIKITYELFLSTLVSTDKRQYTKTWAVIKKIDGYVQFDYWGLLKNYLECKRKRYAITYTWCALEGQFPNISIREIILKRGKKVYNLTPEPPKNSESAKSRKLVSVSEDPNFLI